MSVLGRPMWVIFDVNLHQRVTALVIFLKCRGIVFTHGVRMGGRREIVCPGCISETGSKKFILGRDIGWGGVGVQRHGLTLI